MSSELYRKHKSRFKFKLPEASKGEKASLNRKIAHRIVECELGNQLPFSQPSP